MEAGRRGAIVITTINDAVLLDGYFQNFRSFGHLEAVTVYVVTDRKTPAAAYARCARLRAQGLDVRCPTLSEQSAFLASLGALDLLIPFDSDNRRNVGYLMALRDGADFVVALDDDNFSVEGVDMLNEHAVVCRDEVHETVGTSTGWFNACELLELEPDLPVHPRGFPYAGRTAHAPARRAGQSALVRVNEGLWLGAPDLDALTWLAMPVTATRFRGTSVVLDAGVLTPINTQNTAFHRDVIASEYFLPMNYPIAGLEIDRYGDIFSGYLSQACVQHLGHRVRLGTPIAEHRRNAHDYLHDARSELMCIWILEDLVPWLRELKLQGSSYGETYVSLSHSLADAVERFRGSIWTGAARAYFHRVAYCMRQWADACARLS